MIAENPETNQSLGRFGDAPIRRIHHPRPARNTVYQMAANGDPPNRQPRLFMDCQGLNHDVKSFLPGVSEAFIPEAVLPDTGEKLVRHHQQGG